LNKVVNHQDNADQGKTPNQSIALLHSLPAPFPLPQNPPKALAAILWKSDRAESAPQQFTNHEFNLMISAMLL
jgi:hypothetical protein